VNIFVTCCPPHISPGCQAYAAGIEPLTLRLVAQYFNRLCHHVPYNEETVGK
jgi:hypothetical protein